MSALNYFLLSLFCFLETGWANPHFVPGGTGVIADAFVFQNQKVQSINTLLTSENPEEQNRGLREARAFISSGGNAFLLRPPSALLPFLDSTPVILDFSRQPDLSDEQRRLSRQVLEDEERRLRQATGENMNHLQFLELSQLALNHLDTPDSKLDEKARQSLRAYYEQLGRLVSSRFDLGFLNEKDAGAIKRMWERATQLASGKITPKNESDRALLQIYQNEMDNRTRFWAAVDKALDKGDTRDMAFWSPNLVSFINAMKKTETNLNKGARLDESQRELYEIARSKLTRLFGKGTLNQIPTEGGDMIAVANEAIRARNTASSDAQVTPSSATTPPPAQ